MSGLSGPAQNRRKLLILVLQATLLQCLIAALSPLIALALKTSAEVLFGRALGASGPAQDVLKYFSFADQAMRGMTPYRDYLIEYPILAFPFFWLPRFVAAGRLSYVIVFAIEMLLVNALAVFLVAHLVRMRAGLGEVRDRLTWYTHFFFALSPFIVLRYDLVPMALSLAAVYAWFSGRTALGGALTGIGALVKLFPAVIAGPGLVWEASRSKFRRWWGTGACLVTIGLGVGVWLAFGRAGVWDFAAFHLERGIEVGSLFAGVVMILGKLTGAAMRCHLHHGGLVVDTPWSGAVAALSLPLQAAALLLVLWRFYRSGMRDPIRYCGAAVLAFVVFGSSLSPQYLIWLMPFVALLEGSTGRRARPLFLLCCLGTTALFPWAFLELISLTPFAIALLNLRNLLLLGLLGLLLFGPDYAKDRPAAACGWS